MTEQVKIYSSGLVACSVCAPKAMPRKEIEFQVNQQSPTGISSQWEVSSEAFRTGQSNPTVCEKDDCRLHYLLHC